MRRDQRRASVEVVVTAQARVRVDPAPRRQRIPTGRWYFVVSILSMGTFAWLPFLHAAQRLGTPKAWRLAAIYGAAGVLMIALVGATPTDAAGQPVGVVGHVLQVLYGCVGFVVLGAACVQLVSLRREVYGLGTTSVQQARSGVVTGQQPHSDALDPAVAAVHAARARRSEARALVAKDPLMARELGIGRPDLGRAYDDGGLVDLNNAPAPVIAQICEIDLVSAQNIVDCRNRSGGTFSNVDEVFVMTVIPVSAWDRIRDRAVLVS